MALKTNAKVNLIQGEAYPFTFKRTYSDNDLLIKKKNTNELYEEATDLLSSNFEYEETCETIKKE